MVYKIKGKIFKLLEWKLGLDNNCFFFNKIIVKFNVYWLFVCVKYFNILVVGFKKCNIFYNWNS